MTLSLVVIIVLIILMVILGLGIFGLIPMSQVAINRLFFVLFAVMILLQCLGQYGFLPRTR
jgi:hypothetical protein